MRSSRVISTILLLIFANISICWGDEPILYQAKPERINLSRKMFDVSIEPFKAGTGDWKQYGQFKMQFKNKSGVDIKIEWDKTQFIQEGSTVGGFTSTVSTNDGMAKLIELNSSEIILSHNSIERTLFPNILKSFDHGWNFSPMKGNTGIYLCLDINGKKIIEKFLFNIGPWENK